MTDKKSGGNKEGTVSLNSVQLERDFSPLQAEPEKAATAQKPATPKR
ncbi:MAG: hypothetical protein R3D60_13035 [Paracoccaceae bacterium]